jgi:hypothetical protein
MSEHEAPNPDLSEHVHPDPDPIVDPLKPVTDSAELLRAMDDSVRVINEEIDGTSVLDHPDGSKAWVGMNIRHLELMMGPRVDELGDSPDLSTYETAITAGNAYVAS